MSDGFDDADIDWDAAFTLIEPPTSAARVVAAVKDVLATAEGVPKLAIAYEGVEPADAPTSSDLEVAAGLGAAAVDKPTTGIIDADGQLDEDKLLARLEAQPKSLFERFRRRTNRLSVSDLVGPRWCEVQYFYGLVGKRNRKLENRPSVIIIPPKPGDVGPARQIVPDQATAIARDAILRKGQDVHAKLERELAPVPAQAIYVEGPVDRMGVHLLDLCAALNALLIDGIAIPIFGYIEGLEVSGIIDEVCRKARPRPAQPKTPQSTPYKGKGKAVERPPDQQILDGFFGIKPALPSEPAYGYFLSDHKTRLPSETASIAGRLQCALYKRMWDDIVTGGFSWPDFLVRRHVRDSTAPFSPAFLQQTAELRASVGPGARLGLDDGLNPAHLDELCSIVQRYFQRIGQVEDELALVYLFRDRTQAYPKRTKPMQSTEDADIQRAIDASLRDAAPAPTTGAEADEEDQLRRALAASLEDAPAPPEPDLAVDEESQVTLAHAPSASAPQPATTTPTAERSLHRTASAPTLDAPVASSSSSGGKRKRGGSLPPVEEATTPPSSPSGKEGKVIGTDRFRYDAAALDAHLTDIAQFWRSEREPRGVSIDNTWKCRTCEFATDCEWLERKAEEAAIAFRQAKAARAGNSTASRA